MYLEDCIKESIAGHFRSASKVGKLTGKEVLAGHWVGKEGSLLRTRVCASDKSPYCGLQRWVQEQAPLFFGRNLEVDELVEKMCERGGCALLVIGVRL